MDDFKKATREEFAVLTVQDDPQVFILIVRLRGMYLYEGNFK